MVSVSPSWIVGAQMRDDREDVAWVYTTMPLSEDEAVETARLFIEERGAISCFAAEIKRRWVSVAQPVETES